MFLLEGFNQTGAYSLKLSWKTSPPCSPFGLVQFNPCVRTLVRYIHVGILDTLWLCQSSY